MSYIEDLFSVKGKRAIVTGAKRGLGNCIAKALHDAGAEVLGTDKLEFLDEEFETYTCDIEKKEDIDKLIEHCKNKWDKIDILINNAGVGFAHDFLDYPLDDWETTYKVNLLAPFLLTQGLAPLLIENGKGSIINVTSLNAEQAFPGNPAYPATKGGLKLMSKSFAYELGKHKIRVNNLGPGYFKTDFHRQGDRLEKLNWEESIIEQERSEKTVLGRWGVPNDVVGLVIFLCSDSSTYITGQDIYVDGGWLIKGL